jgi:cobyrinic acid a,c-diamide synthase
MKKSAFIIAGVSSGVGKTTITLGLMAALRKRGFKVQPFKAGPDYIDPSHHSSVCGRPSYNLDSWMMGEAGVKATFSRQMAGADIGIVEGVMGLFDGKGAGDESGSTAHLAKILGLEVILVVEASGIAGSIAALVQGFERFDPEVRVSGVIFNRVGSRRHFDLLKEAVETSCRAKVLGYLPRNDDLTIPERHLGLVVAGESQTGTYEGLADLIGKTIDIDKVLECANRNMISVSEGREAPTADGQVPQVTIAVARDSAFCFYYQENLDLLESFGARLAFFSPIEDEYLPEGTSGIYIGGGYPEIYGERLESNRAIKEAIKNMAKNNMPIYAECGGLIYLGSSVKNMEGNKSFDMTKVFPWQTTMGRSLKTLGYREVTGRKGLPFLEEGQKVRGHEFRYSGIEGDGEFRPVYTVSGRGAGVEEEGYLYRQTLASYIHLHFGSNPDFAEGFVSRCREWSSKSYS